MDFRADSVKKCVCSRVNCVVIFKYQRKWKRTGKNKPQKKKQLFLSVCVCVIA